MSRIKKVYKKIFFVLEVVLIMSLTGCKPSTDEVEESLKDRYGKDFYVGGLTPIDGGYSCLCYPLDNSKQLFDARVNEDGSIYYDQYVAAMMADYYADVLSDEIKELDGVVYVHGYRSGILDDSENDKKIAQTVKTGSFTYEKYYENQKDLYGEKYNIDRSFYVFICRDHGFEEEYECLKKASYKIINKYRDDYNLDIWIHLNVFYVDEADIEKPEQYYSQHADIKSLHEEQLKDWTNNQIDIGFGNDSKVSKSFLISEEQYIERRKEMK